ncbi:hypothetical protein HUE56_26325 (plasmid) [Azospirillum oryzae]|uniref:Uncharacterized protein n=1 Tax=Azospirillum oryzae TaxID=286727 RepID=A0A6N1ARU2_9PROT|nr:hypothetical protein [Azospirillum oryzae]KAA0587892.1 hypothetical protein FZ938_17090 [Azospirillum oryzae]QKS54008.1 hypothetical protein HUE56_26325 [Azospirillum oryzae]GLR77812.1 hypothetical protein GCM10007856_04800 [Azospirillum oryzae]
MTRLSRVAVAYGLAVWLLTVQVVTELVGWLFAWPEVFGGLRLGAVALFWPGQFLTWRGLLAPGHRWIVTVATLVCVAGALALAVRIGLALRGDRGPRFGAGRWAGDADVRRSGLL